MPKLNAIAMVVLALGVIAGAGVMVLRKSTPAVAPEQAELRKLMRNLGDRDPDVGREAQQGLRSIGSKAIAPLEEAARSDDRVLSERARQLLAQIKPSAPPPGAPAVEVTAPEKTEILEFVLEPRGAQARAADLGGMWVQFRNAGPAPVLVAHGLSLDHPKMAVFEVEDSRGARVEVAAAVLHLVPADLREVAAVRPRSAELLFQGGPKLVEALSKPGLYKIRFAYDATEGSDYRKVVHASGEGALLPPVRLTSNAVMVTITE